MFCANSAIAHDGLKVRVILFPAYRIGGKTKVTNLPAVDDGIGVFQKLPQITILWAGSKPYGRAEYARLDELKRRACTSARQLFPKKYIPWKRHVGSAGLKLLAQRSMVLRQVNDV
jgi:hypothetical protein